MTFTIHDLCFLRSMMKMGICPTLMSYMLERSGVTQENLDNLKKEKLVYLCKKKAYGKSGRWFVTDIGKKEYKKQSQGKYF